MYARQPAASERLRLCARAAGHARSCGPPSVGLVRAPRALDTAAVLQLQRAVGNARVAALLERCGSSGCACGGACRQDEGLLLTDRLGGSLNRPPTRVLARLSPEEREEDLQSSKYSDNKRLQRAFDNSPAIHIGESGEAVRLVQEGLGENCFKMPLSTKPTGELDGGFGQETFDVVKAFQRKHGLADDGIVGRDTLRRLDELAMSEPECPRAPEGPPASKPATPPSPTKRVTVNITQVAGSQRNISTSLAVARRIYKQAGIEIVKRTERHLQKDESKAVIGEDLILVKGDSPKASSEERALYRINNTSDAVSAYFVKDMISSDDIINLKTGLPFPADDGQAYPLFFGAGIVGLEVRDAADDVTFAHELGHVLLNDGEHCVGNAECPETLTNLMAVGGPRTAAATLTDAQVKKMRESRFAK
jgi:peptidoglycan hydrolase-like protein with peptidoglycan-binding domain